MNKIFTLLAAAGLAMSANATVLWEGEEVMGSWNGMLSLDCESTNWTPEVASAMADLAVGDKLVFTYTDVSTDDEAPGQIQIDVKVGNAWTWTAMVEYDNIPADGVYTYEITDNIIADTDYTELETLPGRGFFVKGQNATLNKVELVKAGGGDVTPTTGTAVWTGSVEMGSWKGMLEYKNIPENAQWNKTVMGGLKAGDKLVFYYENADAASAQIQLNSFGLDNAWTWTTIIDADPILAGKYTYTIKDEPVGDYTDLEMLSQRGFAVKGQNATLVKVEVVSKGGNQGGDDPEPPVTGGEALWEGEEVMGAWKGMLSLDCESTNWTDKVATAMAGLAEGDKLVFTYKDLEGTDDSPAQIQIDVKVGPDWAWTPMVEYDPIPSNGVYSYEITDSPIADTDYTELETLPTRGFFVKGQAATLVKVELVKKGSSGVENVAVDTAIDFNAPVEIYTIDGRRVSEMTQGRIYILRQGNKVVKVAK